MVNTKNAIPTLNRGRKDSNYFQFGKILIPYQLLLGVESIFTIYLLPSIAAWMTLPDSEPLSDNIIR